MFDITSLKLRANKMVIESDTPNSIDKLSHQNDMLNVVLAV